MNSGAVIPAKAGIQIGKTGFLVKPGMTIKGKGFMTHYIIHPYYPILKRRLYERAH